MVSILFFRHSLFIKHHNPNYFFKPIKKRVDGFNIGFQCSCCCHLIQQPSFELNNGIPALNPSYAWRNPFLLGSIRTCIEKNDLA